jgi:hypothetical protein
MSELEEKLSLSTQVVKISKDVSAFKTFLQSYIDCEIEHIQSSLSKEDSPDIRGAALCYEALATARGLLDLIDGDKDN